MPNSLTPAPYGQQPSCCGKKWRGGRCEQSGARSFHTPVQKNIGFERTIRHLDGHEVVIANRGVSSHGQVLTLRGEGMPVHGVPSEYGDLHVTLKIVVPKQLTSEERAFAAQHFEPAKEAPPGKQPKPR